MNSASLSAAGRSDGGGRARVGRPKLLVSVRSVAEARAAIEGGADIIDVKDPRRGSLGMADPDVIAAVVEFVQRTAPELPVSAALGEILNSQEHVPRVPDGLSFAKAGLAGAGGRTDWPDRWHNARRAIEEQSVSGIRWVGVAYADAESAGAPSVEEIIAEAAAAGCAGVLIDTFGKSGGGLLSLACEGQLPVWVHLIQEAGMFAALAGRIAASDLPRMGEIPADVVAVRSAVCPAHQRDAELSGELVARFRMQLQQAFPLRSRHGFR